MHNARLKVWPRQVRGHLVEQADAEGEELVLAVAQAKVAGLDRERLYFITRVKVCDGSVTAVPTPSQFRN